MSNSVFTPAIEYMKKNSLHTYGPKNFNEYKRENGFNDNTAASISVDSINKLNAKLRDKLVMVFRLGASKSNNGTNFVLRKMQTFSDFFILEDETYIDGNGEIFRPDAIEDLLSFSILPKLSESSLINFGFASGLFRNALELSDISSPATCSSTFSFELKLHSDDEISHLHNNGQVEIDAVFFGRRNGKTVLFVVEAKNGSDRSLAKHKLVYPILALSNNIPEEIEIIPLYLKIQETTNYYNYHFIECEFPNPRSGVRAINELQPINHIHFKIEKPSRSTNKSNVR